MASAYNVFEEELRRIAKSENKDIQEDIMQKYMFGLDGILDYPGNFTDYACWEKSLKWLIEKFEAFLRAEPKPKRFFKDFGISKIVNDPEVEIINVRDNIYVSRNNERAFILKDNIVTELKKRDDGRFIFNDDYIKLDATEKYRERDKNSEIGVKHIQNLCDRFKIYMIESKQEMK